MNYDYNKDFSESAKSLLGEFEEKINDIILVKMLDTRLFENEWTPETERLYMKLRAIEGILKNQQTEQG